MLNKFSQLEAAEYSGGGKDELLHHNSSCGYFLLYLKSFIFEQTDLYSTKYLQTVDAEITSHPLVGFLHIST